MQYQSNISMAKPLSDIQSDEDIIQLSHAIFPGTHCPLFGALMAASYLKDLAVLNIGTEECTFYGKDFSRIRQGGKDLVFSLVTHKNDITFGLEEKVSKAVHDIITTFSPKAVLLISTCVVELIGEDVGAMAKALTHTHRLPILFVKTEHFKCNSHMPGLSDTMAAFATVMSPMTMQANHVNLLGHRFEGFYETELAKLLTKHGIHIHMSIPSACTIDQLQEAGSACLNIVTDFTALPLAKAMEEKLGQPYVVFERMVHPRRILESYHALEHALGINLADDIRSLYDSCLDYMAVLRPQLEGKSFVYGNAPVKALECADFLSELGMTPLWIQMRELYDDDAAYKAALMEKGHDPKISRIANIVPMRTVYDLLKPHFYVGHENPMELIKRHIYQLTFDKEASGLGFQLPLAILQRIEKVMTAPKGGRP